MPRLTHSHRASVRQALKADGCSETEISRTIADIEAALVPAHEDEDWLEAVELTARKIAARKMGLVKDPDGLRLPDDLWTQCRRQAVDFLSDAAFSGCRP